MCFCGGQGGRGGHKVPTISGVSLFSMTCVMCVARANGREGVRREEINPPAEKKKKKKNHTRTYFRIEIQGEREGAGGGREERRGDWGGGVWKSECKKEWRERTGRLGAYRFASSDKQTMSPPESSSHRASSTNSISLLETITTRFGFYHQTSTFLPPSPSYYFPIFHQFLQKPSNTRHKHVPICPIHPICSPTGPSDRHSTWIRLSLCRWWFLFQLACHPRWSRSRRTRFLRLPR